MIYTINIVRKITNSDPTKIYLKPVEPDISRNVGALQQMVNESTISNDSVEGIEPIKK